MKDNILPQYILEASWEVCNMVGGIYTVLSTRARTLTEKFGDQLLFIGPDVWKTSESLYFLQDDDLLKDWRDEFNSKSGLKIRIGRWKIHGTPIAVLVDFSPIFYKKNDIYAHFWKLYGVDSLHAFGDYDESSMFGYAAGMVMESYFRFHKLKKEDNVIAHFNEWMTSFGSFYIKEKVPEIATVFTTHATSIGRSIAGNNKPLYDYLKEYNGDQMAYELNMMSKHSTEKMAAHHADCFTTVSKITARECTQLLEKKPDIVTLNGFEDDFVPSGNAFNEKRKKARLKLKQVAEALFGYKLSKDVFFIVTAGRYEYKNKGIDVFIESLKHLSTNYTTQKEVVAFIMVPANIKGARQDLASKLSNPDAFMDYWNKYTTHELNDYQNNSIINSFRWYHFQNLKSEKIKVIFVPSYLNGNDGIFNMTYWDLLIGMDLSVFPSYYEPWGYTPLESVAFSIPTVTTDLSGFGQWVKDNFQANSGAFVVHRSDYNYFDVCEEISKILFHFISKTEEEINEARNQAREISKRALWDEFITYYFDTYNFALNNRNLRLKR